MLLLPLLFGWNSISAMPGLKDRGFEFCFLYGSSASSICDSDMSSSSLSVTSDVCNDASTPLLMVRVQKPVVIDIVLSSSKRREFAVESTEQHKNSSTSSHIKKVLNSVFWSAYGRLTEQGV
jgi:hypothetical protein